MTWTRGIVKRDLSAYFFRIPRRFLVSTVAVLGLKLAMALVVYTWLGLPSSNGFWMDGSRMPSLVQNRVLLNGVNVEPRWTYLFLGWDGAWYLSILTGGYSFSDQSFAFFPGLPLFAGALGAPLLGPFVALVGCSFVFGVLWVPLFQVVAERYMGRKEALLSTLLVAASPFLMLFTTVAYTEGMFLFFTLAAWALFMREKHIPAFLAATVATLVRPPGILIALPMFLALIRRGGRVNYRKAALGAVLPVVSLSLWVLYLGATSGDPLAVIHTTEWAGMYTLQTYLTQVLPGGGLAALSFPIAYPDIHWLLPISIWCALILPPLLIWRLRRHDTDLALYGAAYYVGILTFGTVLSLPSSFQCFSRCGSRSLPNWRRTEE